MQVPICIFMVLNTFINLIFFFEPLLGLLYFDTKYENKVRGMPGGSCGEEESNAVCVCRELGLGINLVVMATLLHPGLSASSFIPL